MPTNAIGPIDPTAAANDASAGGNSWSTTSNALTANNAYATAVVNLNQLTQYLVTRAYDFSELTDDWPVVGIQFDVHRRNSAAATGNACRDYEVRVMKGGVIQTAVNRAAADVWPTGEATKVYGGSSDLWGLSWLASEIRATGFGCAIRASGSSGLGASPNVDVIQATVYYQTTSSFNSNLTLFVHGSAPDSGVIPLYIPGAVESQRITLYTNGHDSDDDNTTLVIHGHKFVETSLGTGPTATNAANFVGDSTESLSRADNADLSSGDFDFTWAGWFYIDSLSANRTLFGKHNSVAGQFEWLIRVTTAGNVNLILSSNGATNDINKTVGTMAINGWHYVMFWHDSVANTANVQIDNGTVNSTSHSAGVFDGSHAFKIGLWGSVNEPLDGRADSVARWNRVLTTEERTALYNDGQGLRYSDLETSLKTSLVSWWDLEETSGTRDDSHGSNDLTDNGTVGFTSGILGNQQPAMYFFIGSHGSGEDVTTLYTAGPLVAETGIPLYIGVGTPDSGNIPLSIHGNTSDDSEITLFISGPAIDSGNTTLFIHGHEVEDGSLNLMIHAGWFSSGNANVPLFLDGVGVGVSGMFAATKLFLEASEFPSDMILYLLGPDTVNASGNMNLYVGGDATQFTNTTTLFVCNSGLADSVNLFIEGQALSDADDPFFPHAGVPATGLMNLYISRNNVDAQFVPLHIQNAMDSDDMPLFVPGAFIHESGLNMFMSTGAASVSGLPTLYTHGF